MTYGHKMIELKSDDKSEQISVNILSQFLI